jgi:2,5-diketo-D-gluconate reductase A
MEKYGTQIESWGPFAEGRNDFFNNETLKEIGEQYGKSVAQVALRFLIQRNVVVIPKTVTKERMIQNFDVFDFALTNKDMEEIAKLDQEQSLFFSHYDPETVELLTGLGK